ncbi:MAG: fused response regulator/phosphatase [Alphaproteobacteria bacterium]|nr:fused response regulator/phosphatase [Alphaproteobacteria bacterium]
MTNELSRQILDSHIVIVDDIEINRLFLEKTLRACGFHNFLCLASTKELLVKIKDFQPDLVLLDILFPSGMDGFDCCEVLRRDESYRDLPILIETSIVEPELRVKAFKKGATDFVSKPIDPAELCARVNVHLEKRHSLKALQLYKSRVEAELENARQLQRGLLPEPEQMKECEQCCGLTIDAAFYPSSEIGGDLWGVQTIFPYQVALWLVDFSGHGMVSALNAFRLHAYLKEHVPEAARPGAYLSQLNDKLLNVLPRGQFASMFYGIVDTQSNQLFFARAYMTNPIILHSSTGKAEKLKGSAPPLGVGMHFYSTQTVPFLSGDVLVLYSDALIETANAAGVFMTEEYLITLVEENASASVFELKDILFKSVKEHAGDLICDDLTIVVCGR